MRQNFHDWSTTNSRKYVEGTFHPAKIGVWCIHIMKMCCCLLFFESTINSEVYQNLIRSSSHSSMHLKDLQPFSRTMLTPMYLHTAVYITGQNWEYIWQRLRRPTWTECVMGVLHFFSANSRNTHSLDKYVRIKIEDHKILVVTSMRSSKLDEVNASYACKCNSILRDSHVFH